MARILLADDDGATRDFVKRALLSDGHQVDVTHDGNEALDRLLASEAAYDLLITDVQMPVLDGISLAERAVKATPEIRIVLMSGFTEELDRAKTFKARKLGSISKPFTLEQIRALVRSTLA